jgi:hypothetical protein
MGERQMSDPEVMRYGFDGFGYKYIDSGSGSDWRTRHPDAEPLYARQPTQSDALREALETARDYVADVAVGNIHFNDNIKAMAAEDLTRIDAALQEQSK